ncbi:hypothetical protein [Paraburkholderia sp. SOS3]|jgi:hypothetical protein|uniref:hypothetical protein n=1 Tax=Paraburkholderia sp. SOS3 TaxID=1926494 RepID=UPI00094739A0|nr:hypothetical protein [Paraburkholderia sp. SOS3]APR39091.1 hypothetical protein BTO02_27460 [Paraburkholderia sp. SOS3]
MFSITRKMKQAEARSAERDRIKSLEQRFGQSFHQLRALFADGPADLERARLPSYPVAIFNRDIGINAFGLAYDMESAQFPRFLNLVRTASEERDWLCFRSEADGRATSTLLRTESRFRGVSVKMLSNDVELIRSIERQRFSPAPPWVAMYEHGPFLSLSQGEEQYWLEHIWVPFWRSLTIEEQGEFVRGARGATRHYLSEGQWRDWLIELRGEDPRTRNLDDEAVAQLNWS